VGGDALVAVVKERPLDKVVAVRRVVEVGQEEAQGAGGEQDVTVDAADDLALGLAEDGVARRGGPLRLGPMAAQPALLLSTTSSSASSRSW